MDIETKKNELRGRVYGTANQLQTICASVGMANSNTGSSLYMALDNHIRTLVELRMYEIVSSAEFFALTVHGAADLGDKLNGNSN